MVRVRCAREAREMQSRGHKYAHNVLIAYTHTLHAHLRTLFMLVQMCSTTEMDSVEMYITWKSTNVSIAYINTHTLF